MPCLMSKLVYFMCVFYFGLVDLEWGKLGVFYCSIGFSVCMFMFMFISGMCQVGGAISINCHTLHVNNISLIINE